MTLIEYLQGIAEPSHRLITWRNEAMAHATRISRLIDANGP